MKVYSHARQFPHLAGKTDAEIRLIARRAIGKRPGLALLMRARNVAIILGMIMGGALLRRHGDLSKGAILMVIGGAGFLLTLCWNFVGVNKVLYKLTEREVAENPAG